MTQEQQEFLMRMSTWKAIRGEFSEEEKAKLNAAIVGQAICPNGVFLSSDKLGPELVEKIRTLKAKAVVQR